MKVIVISPNNYYGLPGALARYLNRIEGISAGSMTYDVPLYGYGSETVLREMDPPGLERIIADLLSADIIHLFDHDFQVGKFVLDEHLRSDNALITYTPGYFKDNYGKIFFRHFRSGLVATTWPIDPGYSLCPVPFVHLPLVVDLEDLPQPPRPRNVGRIIIATATRYGDQAQMAEVSKIIVRLKNKSDLALNCLDNLSRPEYLEQLTKSDLFIDSYGHPGLTPMGLEAMACGAVVITNMTGLDYTLNPDAPVIPAGLANLEQAIKDVISRRERMNDLKAKSAHWVKENYQPEKCAGRWSDLYQHIKNGGKELEHYPGI
ncbi:MAG: glycosyltransferase [Deltaproteobacteria bacterium]|nr:glycosyltransferase [Deltaproteobacteria bacterium]